MPVNSNPALSKRDPRLDFFRGIAMFIILIAHTPGNWWVNWIPARFGFSDATEIFVFCSGMASAIAFGKIFEQQGMAMGTARILHRVWQVYWAHIALFFAIVAQLIAIDKLLDAPDTYTGTYNLIIFFDNIRDTILGLLTLTYVPNYWDILPMYLVILTLIPLIMLLRRLHPYAPFIFSVSLWLVAGQGYLDLPAEPWSDRPWFFNPFAWQLVFFTGFSLMRGWLPTPPIRKDWMIAAGIVLLASLPFSQHLWLQDFKGLQEIRYSMQPLSTKTNFGLFRYLHFLALAYLGYSFSTLYVHKLTGLFVDMIRKVGQQSLAVFMSSLFIAQTLGTLIHLAGVNAVTVTIMNFVGFAALIAIAYVVAWFKSTPWKPSRAPQASGNATAGSSGGAPKPEERRVEDTDDYAREFSGPKVSPAE